MEVKMQTIVKRGLRMIYTMDIDSVILFLTLCLKVRFPAINIQDFGGTY
jgi:hypothetical protein